MTGKNNIVGVYCIYNLQNGKFYIGSSRDVLHRVQQHFSTLKRGCNSNKPLQADYNLYGRDAFTAKVLVRCRPEELLRAEQIYLSKVKPTYNISPIADDGGTLMGFNPFTKSFTHK